MAPVWQQGETSKPGNVLSQLTGRPSVYILKMVHTRETRASASEIKFVLDGRLGFRMPDVLARVVAGDAIELSYRAMSQNEADAGDVVKR